MQKLAFIVNPSCLWLFENLLLSIAGSFNLSDIGILDWKIPCCGGLS